VVLSTWGKKRKRRKKKQLQRAVNVRYSCVLNLETWSDAHFFTVLAQYDLVYYFIGWILTRTRSWTYEDRDGVYMGAGACSARPAPRERISRHPPRPCLHGI
jgi:hypothetical protein